MYTYMYVIIDIYIFIIHEKNFKASNPGEGKILPPENKDESNKPTIPCI